MYHFESCVLLSNTQRMESINICLGICRVSHFGRLIQTFVFDFNRLSYRTICTILQQRVDS